MFLGYQKGKIKFYTKEPLKKEIYNLDKVEETNSAYVLEGEEYVLFKREVELQKLKEEKIKENDSKRDEKLNSGVLYKNILFDSDTDQKVNLLATVSTMDDGETITWFGMNNEALIASRSDLLLIGALITQLHTFCWTKNAEIKKEINEATTIEEVKTIEINYEETEEE